MASGETDLWVRYSIVSFLVSTRTSLLVLPCLGAGGGGAATDGGGDSDPETRLFSTFSTVIAARNFVVAKPSLSVLHDISYETFRDTKVTHHPCC